jgi:hypothetical protein
LFRPQEAIFSGAWNPGFAMIRRRPSARFCYQDRCESLLVRGAPGQSHDRILRILMCITVAICLADFVIAAPRPNAPDDRVVTKVVDDYFASQPGYEKGDLITKSQIEKIVAKLASRGVKISDSSNITKLALADDSFLVRELSTADGKKFMRKVAARPGAYSRLDRLSTIPRGHTLIRDLMRTKDGDKMIDYLVTTKGGKNMGSMMAQARGGVDLNKPTERIYTADDLVVVLNRAITKR